MKKEQATCSENEEGMTSYEKAIIKRNKNIESYLKEKKEYLMKIFRILVVDLLSLIINDLTHEKIFIYTNIVKGRRKLCNKKMEMFILYGNHLAKSVWFDIPDGMTPTPNEILYNILKDEGIPFKFEEVAGNLFNREFICGRDNFVLKDDTDRVIIDTYKDKYDSFLEVGDTAIQFNLDIMNGEFIKIIY